MSHINLSDIDLRLLRVFKAVAECGGYGAAEMELNINRSTISTHISHLEIRLGMKLCNRGRGRTVFSLTAQGAEVYEALKALFADLNDFRNRVSAIRAELTGKLRIAMPDDWLQLTQIDLAPAIARFRQQAPQVEMEVMAHAPHEIELDLINNHADLAINATFGTRSGLEYVFLYSHHTSLYCSHGHPLFDRRTVTAEDLAQCELVGGSHTLSEAMHNLYKQFPRRAIANHMSGRVVMILSGTYVGFLPDYFARQWLEQGLLQRIEVEGFDYVVDNCVICRKGARTNPLIDLFVAEIFKQISSS